MNNLLREAKPIRRSRYGLAMLSTTIIAAIATLGGCALAFAEGPSAPDTMKLTPRNYSMPAGDHGAVTNGPMVQVMPAPRRIPIGNAAQIGRAHV